MNAAAIVFTLIVVLRVPVSLELSSWNFLRLTALYLAAATPVLFHRTLFSVVFARESHHITRLYGADLVGGAAACLAIVPLLNIIGGPNTVLFAAFIPASPQFSGSEGSRARLSRSVPAPSSSSPSTTPDASSTSFTPRACSQSRLGRIRQVECHLTRRSRSPRRSQSHRHRCRRLHLHHERRSSQVAGYRVATQLDGRSTCPRQCSSPARRIRHHRSRRRC